MAKKNTSMEIYDVPATLQEHPFYGLRLDEYQKVFRDAIWDTEKLIVFCNAKAGTGKTLIATATANLLYQYGRCNGIVYIASPTQEQKQGYLKGTIEEKSDPYFEPFYEALEKIGVNRNTAFYDGAVNEKYQTAYIQCATHTFLRGTNFENKVVIIDEAQNLTPHEVKTIISRCGEDTKMVLTGDPHQIDNPYLDASSNGLSYTVERLKGQNLFGHVTLARSERS